jgi:NADPH-dependent 2,4-dienoyl-CoA reductase/sulfur reductase-like enzyme/rhodanese-related sulfurtransferase
MYAEGMTEKGRPMKLVIVGGTAAGMSCAARARRLNEDASITVIEKTPHVSSASCGLPYYLSGQIASREALSIETPDSLHASLNITVMTRSEATGFDAERVHVSRAGGETVDIDYDELVLAPGTHAFEPPMNITGSPNIRTLRTIEDAQSIHEAISSGAKDIHVVVIGGGFIGIEAAENLAERKIPVTLVEASPHPLPMIDDDIASYATQSLRHLGVDLRLGTTVDSLEATDHGTEVSLSDGSHLTASLILSSAGVRPSTQFAERSGVECSKGWIITDEHGRTGMDHVWAAGDATLRTDMVTGRKTPLALAGPSNRDGRLVADAIMDPEHARPIPGTLGTAIVRVGQTVIATTGPTSRTLRESGIDFDTLHLLPSQHAGYYPGAEQIDMRVRVGRDGAILGAQIAGGSGVDKRIDVIATAMRGGLRAEDLIDLDLAYAPPFGSAKDPVNFVGYMAQDLHSGLLRQIQPEDFIKNPTGFLLLDVRSPFEYEQGHIPSSLHIPHTRIREHIDEIRKTAQGKTTLVICESGKRAYLAHRILQQNGIDSTVLSGGMNTLSRILQAGARGRD